MSVQTDPAFVDHPATPLANFYLTKLRTFASLGLIATVLALFGAQHWVADLFSQFKFQLAFGLGVLALLFLLAKRWEWGLFCVIGFCINAYPILPYFFTQPETANQTAPTGAAVVSLRMMSLNVLTKNRKWDEVLEHVKAESPDFLVLMEIDSTWEQVLGKGLGELYPYAKYESRMDNFGIAFLSKHRWAQIKIFESQTLSLPSVDVVYRELNGSGLAKPLRIIGTHPIPPMSKRNWEARNEQLFNVAGRLDDSTANVMVGDFNLAPWSPNFAKVLDTGGLKDPSVGFGPATTWQVFPSWIGGLKIDHALVNKLVRPTKLRIGVDVGSDHRAVILDFEL